MTSPEHRTAEGDGRVTPPEIAALVHTFFGQRLALDPCWNPSSPIRATRTVAPPEDGLAVDWTSYGTAYVNGPWSELHPWVSKASESFRGGGCEILFLARTESATAWARDLIATRCAHADLYARYCFPVEGKPATTDTRPTTVSYYGDRVQRFAAVFGAVGAVYGRPL